MIYKRDNRSKDRYVFHNAVNEFISNPDFVYFVSFPRTGSHWLRMFMERYTGMPSLVQSFTIPEPKSFWSYHRHDKALDEVNGRKNVLYLYRNPVDTLYSQISYEKEIVEESIDRYIDMYSKHLIKWLYNNDAENFKSITYESLKNSPFEEISKVLNFLKLDISESKMMKCYDDLNKNSVKKVTGNTNNGVINLSDNYENDRRLFKRGYSDYILNSFRQIDKRLDMWI